MIAQALTIQSSSSTNLILPAELPADFILTLFTSVEPFMVATANFVKIVVLIHEHNELQRLSADSKSATPLFQQVLGKSSSSAVILQLFNRVEPSNNQIITALFHILLSHPIHSLSNPQIIQASQHPSFSEAECAERLNNSKEIYPKIKIHK